MRKYLFYFCLSFLPILGFGQILEEGFDDITTLTGDGWTMTNQSDSPGTTEWFQGNETVFAAYEGATTSYIGANYNNTAGSVISNWLITPTVNVKDGDVISFYTRTTDFTGTVWNDRLEVRMSTGTMTVPSTGPTDVGSFTTVMGIINDAMDDSYPHVWTQYEYTVSGVGTTPVAANFAFRYNVPTSAGPLGTNSDYMGIDSVLISDGGGTGGGDELLIVDLTTENQVTITATTGASVGTVSGSTTTGFYFENLFSNAGEQGVTNTYVGVPTLTAASVPTDNTPSIFRSGNTDPGLNIWSYSATTPTTFTTGEQAFTGDATWTITPELYAAMLTAPTSGNVYFPGDDVTDLATATLLGTYTVILPSVEVEGCLEAENGQYPSTTYVPSCSGMPENITTVAWTGEYSMVQVTAGTEYIFSVSDPSYFITIGNEAGDTVLASGTGSVTWTSDADQNVRFYGHFDSDCNWDSITFYSRIVQCGEVPPPPSDCSDFEVLSNALENGLFFGGDTAQHLATDIPVGDTGFTLYGMNPTFIGEATTATFTFYEDAGGLPGTMIGSGPINGTLGEGVYTGTNFGYDFYQYPITFDTPMPLDANTTYWVEIESDAVAWETTSASMLGYDDVFYNTNVGEGVWTATGGDEYVFSLMCENPGTGGACSTEYVGTMQDGLGNTQTLIIANDFPVTANTVMHIDQFTVNIFGNIGGTADIYIYEDAGGMPGAEISPSNVGVPFTSETLIGTAFGFNVYQYVFDLTNVVDATAGDSETLFWVGLMTTVGSEGVANYWEKADLNTNNDAVVSSDGGVTWTVNSFGQDGAFTISGMCETMGVSDMNSYDFAYYPNPVRDVLNIETQKTIENVSVHNLAGQTVMQNLKAENGQVNMSGLTPGVYVFRVTLQGGQVETFKVIKK